MNCVLRYDVSYALFMIKYRLMQTNRMDKIGYLIFSGIPSVGHQSFQNSNLRFSLSGMFRLKIP
jgi:hypothetical protein